jgi:hypothetical protein
MTSVARNLFSLKAIVIKQFVILTNVTIVDDNKRDSWIKRLGKQDFKTKQKKLIIFCCLPLHVESTQTIFSNGQLKLNPPSDRHRLIKNV